MTSEKDYLATLKRARKNLPAHVFEKSRFQIPKADVFKEGNKTWITDWGRILKILNRESESDHLAKHLAREFATSSTEERGRLCLQGKFSGTMINRELETYVKEFVLCEECGKPDTKLAKEGRILIKVCEACGARGAVK
ncbi:MAG: translation initiation factor IF-2 subunit beta [Candidatus Heimdallarchaeota archaeon]|nr:MAG: translation initiation factor IF-2 subunit beta [Candidatus Heimdallarchaeota archaeon]